MYSILIVDDEKYVIKSLIARISWDEYGFEIAGYAQNAADALVSVRQKKPDLLFIDIRMPGMSGIELIREIKKDFPDQLIIIISGYAEFSYAQEAIVLGVLGYCLKPFDDAEIITLLKKAVEILAAGRISQTKAAAAYLQEVHSGPEIEQKLAEYNIHISPAEPVRIMSVFAGKFPDFPELAVKLPLETGNSKYFCFLQNYTKESRRYLLLKSACVKSIGISREIYDPVQIRNAVRESQMLAFGYFTSPDAPPVFDTVPNPGSSDRTLRELKEAVLKEDRVCILSLLDRCKILFREGKFGMQQALFIYDALTDILTSEADHNVSGTISADELTAKYADAAEMTDECSKKLVAQPLVLHSPVQPTYNKTFRLILEYINKNFRSDVSVQDLSGMFNLNAAYICQLFRKELKMTLSEYITELRIDYAADMLRKTCFSIGEVAEKAGYKDVFYFSRVFKKLKQTSPQNFRSDRH
ncbi:MAG: response regulator [Treponema sp.]